MSDYIDRDELLNRLIEVAFEVALMDKSNDVMQYAHAIHIVCQMPSAEVRGERLRIQRIFLSKSLDAGMIFAENMMGRLWT